MTTAANIKCCNCNNSFSIYWTALTEDRIQCPHCFASMDDHMTTRTKEALGTVVDLNMHFVKYADERDENRFEVNIVETHVPSDKFRIGE